MQAICCLNFVKFFKKVKFFYELLKYAKIDFKIFKMNAAARVQRLTQLYFLGFIFEDDAVDKPR